MSYIEKQQISPKKQRIVVIKVISAMLLFLLGIPFLMFLATGYYTKKGLAMDVYLMGQEYSDRVNQFYKENNICPTDQDITPTITELDVAKKINFLTNPQNNTCYIVLSFKSLKGTFTDKILVLSKAFDQQTTANSTWQCHSNIQARYLPENCSANIPKIITTTPL